MPEFALLGQTISLLEVVAFVTGLLSVWLTLRPVSYTHLTLPTILRV